MDNQKQTQKNKISEMIESALDSIRGIADSGTVIGTPITTAQGTTIIPVSKVSVGFAGGGNDFTGKNGGDGKNVFSGGGGTGVSVVPQAFLVVSAEGNVELLSLSNPTGSAPMSTVGASIDTLIDRAPEIIEKVKSIIGSKKKKDEEKEAEKAPEAPVDASAEPAAEA
jgi:sporulation protein YtfJ